MNKLDIWEIAVSVALIFLLFLLFWEEKLLMPNDLSMMVILAFILVFALFAAVFFKESAKDERESLHRLISARFAFFAGCAVLALGVVVQSLSHAVDIWLLITLSTMVLFKIVGSVYGRMKH